MISKLPCWLNTVLSC